jgi:hypothetical protein
LVKHIFSPPHLWFAEWGVELKKWIEQTQNQVRRMIEWLKKLFYSYMIPELPPSDTIKTTPPKLQSTMEAIAHSLNQSP